MAPKNQLRAHREELQRVQIGLVGLAGVLLIVTLANIVVDSARRDNASETVSAEGAAINDGVLGSNMAGLPKTAGNEPLADLGVTPTTEGSATPVLPSPVPDLEPDPQLRQRMDQDPQRSQTTP